MERNLKYWLLWIVLVPSVILAGVLVTVPVHLVIDATLNGMGFDLPHPEAPERILQPFFSGLALIYAAYYVAPEFKIETCFIFVLLWVFVIGIGVALSVFNVDIGSTSSLTLQYYGLPIILGIAGAVTGLVLAKKKHSEILL